MGIYRSRRHTDHKPVFREKRDALQESGVRSMHEASQIKRLQRASDNRRTTIHEYFGAKHAGPGPGGGGCVRASTGKRVHVSLLAVLTSCYGSNFELLYFSETPIRYADLGT